MKGDMAEFDAFWAAYPRKIAKGDARKAWMQTDAIRPRLSVVLASIEAAKATEQWQRDRGQFVPYPATWLRAERWDDVHTVEVPMPAADIDCTPAWMAFRQSIRDNRTPADPILAQIMAKFGGVGRLGEQSSWAIENQYRKDFEAAYRAAKSH